MGVVETGNRLGIHRQELDVREFGPFKDDRTDLDRNDPSLSFGVSLERPLQFLGEAELRIREKGAD